MGGGGSASGSGDSAGVSWILVILFWLSSLTEVGLSSAAGRIEGLFESLRDNDEDAWEDDFAEPFIVPAIEGRGALGGGPIEVRFVGGSIDLRVVFGAVLVPGVDLLERVDELSCLVGDLFGDWIGQLDCAKPWNDSKEHLPPTLKQVQTSLRESGCQHSRSVSSLPLDPTHSVSSRPQRPYSVVFPL